MVDHTQSRVQLPQVFVSTKQPFPGVVVILRMVSKPSFFSIFLLHLYSRFTILVIQSSRGAPLHGTAYMLMNILTRFGSVGCVLCPHCVHTSNLAQTEMECNTYVNLPFPWWPRFFLRTPLGFVASLILPEHQQLLCSCHYITWFHMYAAFATICRC